MSRSLFTNVQDTLSSAFQQYDRVLDEKGKKLKEWYENDRFLSEQMYAERLKNVELNSSMKALKSENERLQGQVKNLETINDTNVKMSKYEKPSEHQKCQKEVELLKNKVKQLQEDLADFDRSKSRKKPPPNDDI